MQRKKKPAARQSQRRGHATSAGPKPPPRAREAMPLRALMEGSAAFIRAVDQPAFPPLVTALLRRFCPVQDCCVTAYAPSVPPVVVYYELDPDQIDLAVTQYEKGAYRLDPFYHACIGDQSPGVYRLLDLAPDDFRRSTYYRDYYNLMRPYDEVGLLVRPDNDTAIMFSFGLTPQAAPTRARQIALLQSAFPMFAAAIERHWARVAKARLSPGGGKRKGGARSAAQGDGFGATALSAREAEVVDLVLRGHSSHAISGQLGIAEATVKIHRKNAYAKLGVASQAELFARYLHFALSRKA